MSKLSELFVTHGLDKTVDGVREAIRRFETNNADLDSRTRRMMALGSITHHFGLRLMESALQQRIPLSFYRDQSWFYWNVLVLSHLDDHWPAFVELVGRKAVRGAAAYLKKNVSPEHYELFLRRSGRNPALSNRPTRHYVWTKAGTWPPGPFTKLLVLQQHLPERTLVLPYQRRLGHAGVRLIEQELFTLLDPDVIFPHVARERAVRWVTMRIKDLTGHRAGAKVAAWFFQSAVPDKDGHVWRPDTNQPWHVRKYYRKTFNAIKGRWEW